MSTMRRDTASHTMRRKEATPRNVTAADLLCLLLRQVGDAHDASRGDPLGASELGHVARRRLGKAETRELEVGRELVRHDVVLPRTFDGALCLRRGGRLAALHFSVGLAVHGELVLVVRLAED